MQKRSAAALIWRSDLRRCITRILSLALCCVFVVALSQTAAAADATDDINFVELVGWELADGEQKKVTFDTDAFMSSVMVTNTTTVDDFVQRFNRSIMSYGVTLSYDRSSGQFVAVDTDGGKVDFVLSSAGEELSVKLPTGTSDGMSALLSAFDTVVTLLNIVWTLMLSNPLMTLFLAEVLVLIGVRAFRQLKRATK